MSLEVGTSVGGYSVRGVLGAGNAATVYEVVREGTEERFALKLLSWQDDALRDRMTQEGRALAALKHDNVVRIYEVVEHARQPGLVLELVDGGFTLGAAMARQPVTIDQAEVIVRALLEGAAAAHALGIVHRDLKPDNILLARAANNLAIAKISDFGLAKVQTGAGSTQSGSAMGHPKYVAPEQLRDAKTVDQRADVWSIAAIGYELLGGKPVIAGATLIDAATAHAAGAPPSVKTLRPELADRLVTALDRALVVDPKQRVGSCKEMLALWDGPAGPKPPGGGAAWKGFWRDEARRAAPPPPPAAPRAPLAVKTIWGPDEPEKPAASVAPVAPAPAPSPPSSGPPVWALAVFGVGAFALVATLVVGVAVVVGFFAFR